MHATKAKLVLSALLAVAAPACSSDVEDVESTHQSSNVPTTEENGVVSAELKADATTDQTVVASAGSNVADAAVTIPPGSLAVTTTIALGEAEDQSAAILKATTGAEQVVTKSASPLFAGPTGDPVATAGDLLIDLPLPVDAASLSLTTAAGKLVFLYSVYTSEGWKSGVKTLTTANLVGTFLHTGIKGFGYFQIAYVPTSVEDKEVVTETKPSLKK
jgi:hypothetical protein